MATEDRMSIDERRKYLVRMRQRYKVANKRQKGTLLDEMEQVTELHRKSLIRLLNGSLARRRRSRERGRRYGPRVDDALRVICASLDRPCAERLHGNLVGMANDLAAHHELEVCPELLADLERISLAQLRRILQRLAQDQPRLPRRKPTVSPPLTRGIPMTRISWQEPEPGHFEVDLVHHSGPNASGEYVYTIQMVDVATAWSERVAVLGRSWTVIQDGFRRILARLPFPVRELHPDNGSEFFSAHLLRFWQQTVPGAQWSRSRPYHKNDNRFVEQKNSALVRAYLGHDRLDSVAQTLALNALYEQLWLYYNFFQPVLRLSEKTIVATPNGDSRVQRRYGQAQTPWQRLCATDVLTPEQRQPYEQLRTCTNPRQLNQHIHSLLDHLLSLPCAQPGETQDVHETLNQPIPHLTERRGPLGNIISWKNIPTSVTLSFG
jgi:hypothetical protein